MLTGPLGSVPPGFIALVMIFLAMPVGFPYRSEKSAKILQSFTMAGVQSIDFLGAFLVLAASILSVSALEEGGTEYPWKSSVVLSLLCLSVILWVLFFLWQKVLSGRADAREPILPWRLLTDRFTMGFLL